MKFVQKVLIESDSQHSLEWVPHLDPKIGIHQRVAATSLKIPSPATAKTRG